MMKNSSNIRISLFAALVLVIVSYGHSIAYAEGGKIDLFDIFGAVEYNSVTVPMFYILMDFLSHFAILMLGFYAIESQRRLVKRVAIYAAGVVTISVLNFLIIYLVRVFAFGIPTDGMQSDWIWFYYIIAGLQLFIPLSIYSIKREQQTSSKYEKLKAENAISKYNALRNQLDPHFLFNTISVLDSLIDIDKERAHDYVARFSSLYRYMLQSKESATLSEEMAFVEDYIALISIRYGEGLIIKRQIDSSLLNSEVIPLSVQTLIENAVKHNMASVQKPLCITIATTKDGTLEVSNNIQLKEFDTYGTRVGLSNITELYSLRWGGDVTVEQSDENFIVTLPLKR